MFPMSNQPGKLPESLPKLGEVHGAKTRGGVPTRTSGEPVRATPLVVALGDVIQSSSHACVLVQQWVQESQSRLALADAVVVDERDE